jgi:hypothetical protein
MTTIAKLDLKIYFLLINNNNNNNVNVIIIIITFKGVYGGLVRDSTSVSQMVVPRYRGDLGRLVPDSLQLSPMPPSGTPRKLRRPVG